MARYSIVKRHRKYYKYGTEPNATVVGSFAKIDKGVASGFDETHYLTLPIVFNPETRPWEIVTKIKTPSSFATYNCVWGTIGTYRDGLQFVGNKIYLYLSSNGTSWDISGTSLASTVTFNTNTTYYFKTYFTGTEYKVDYKTEDGEYANCITLSSSTPIFSSTSHFIGLGTNRGNTAWLGDGSIDLNESYIKINGERWWSGDSYTKVGSWIDDGVVSGFTTANYLTLPSKPDVGSKPWEMVLKVTTDSSLANQGLIGVSSNGILRVQLLNKKLEVHLSTSTESFNIASSIDSRELTANTSYWFKIEFTGSAYNLYLSTDGSAYNLEATKQTTTAFVFPATTFIGRHRDTAWKGSIDLSKSYIKINGQDWWHGTKVAKTTEDDHEWYVDNNKLYTPTRRRRDYYKYGTEPNVTVVGSPTIVDGVASGFTTANYLTTPKVFNPLGSEVECVFKVNLTALARYNPMLCQSGSVQFHKFSFNVQKDGRMRFYAGNGSAVIVSLYSNIALEINKDYWLKLHIKDNVYSLYYSLDGKDYIFDNSVTDTNTILEMTAVAAIGAQRDPATGSSSYFTGSIDLRESYVKINGEDWWHGTKVVKSTADDYKWFVDKNIAYNLVYKPYEVISQTFNVSSELQTYVVPEDVSSVNVVCVASRGGNTGGNGGYVKCDLSVTAGQTLYVMVGGIPSNTYTASYNASDIRIGGTEYANRVIVAGGGGSKSSKNAAGGAGGGLTGGNGGKGYGGSSMGKGGTQTAGGAGGSGTPVDVGHYHNGGAGTFGLGGTGSHDSSYEGDAGAGGAGWYGGGAGAGDWNKNGGYTAGGGGGSSYTDNTLCSNVVHIQGSNGGAGYVKISYIKEL